MIDYEGLWFGMLLIVGACGLSLALDLFITLVCRWYGMDEGDWE